MSSPDSDSYKAQAARCRRMARLADEPEAQLLNEMADEYEAKARALDQR